jgi:YggT family protein
VAILLRVVFSWIAIDPGNPIYTIVQEVTEPILAPIRAFIPRIGMLDLSPMIASVLLIIILRAAMSL